MHEVLVNRLGGLSLPRKSVVRLTDRPDMTLDVYRGRKTTQQLVESVTTQDLVSPRFFAVSMVYSVSKFMASPMHPNSLPLLIDMEEPGIPVSLALAC